MVTEQLNEVDRKRRGFPNRNFVFFHLIATRTSKNKKDPFEKYRIETKQKHFYARMSSRIVEERYVCFKY